MTDNFTVEDARKRNEALRRVARIDRAEIDELTTDLRNEARRNHFAERLELAFATRRPAWQK